MRGTINKPHYTVGIEGLKRLLEEASSEYLGMFRLIIVGGGDALYRLVIYPGGDAPKTRIALEDDRVWPVVDVVREMFAAGQFAPVTKAAIDEALTGRLGSVVLFIERNMVVRSDLYPREFRP